MRIAAALLVLAASVILLAASLFAAPLRWTPANFRGLTLGNARRADVVRVLGPPDMQSRKRDSQTPNSQVGEELIYKGRGDHKGDLILRLDRAGVIVEIQESFPVAIPRTRIYKELGRDAVTAHYSRDRCGVPGKPAVGLLGSDTLYHDPNGAIELTLYPARGIYLWPDQYGYDFAAMYYAARPPGVSRPRCAVGTSHPR
jgi:hypothetical protein